MRRPPATGDHLAELFFARSGASSGSYTPERITLALAGIDSVVDRVVFIHEVHHAGLNDQTAWGTALHVLAALPAHQSDFFLPLLDVCRLPHEAYATFASISVAGSGREALNVLAQYPAYVPLYRAMEALTAVIDGHQRRYLAATALARAAMQAPVLSLMLERDDLRVTPGDLRAIDTPNGRWRWYLANSAAVFKTFRAADDHVREAHGDAALAADAPGVDALELARGELDHLWNDWEQAAYRALIGELGASGATTLDFNGHMQFTDAVLERARAIEPDLSLRAARITDPAPDDRSLAAATIEQVRLQIAESRWPARIVDMDVQTLVESVELRSRVAGQPALILSARLPRRLLQLYEWTRDDRLRLEAARSPIVAARTVIPEADDANVIAHALIETPNGLARLAGEWAGRGPLVSLISASCLVDEAWRDAWLQQFTQTGPVIVVIDIALARFVASWRSRAAKLRAGLISVQDTSGSYWAVAVSASDEPWLWLLVTDEISAKLFLSQLRQTTDVEVTETTTHINAWSAMLPPALTHLLATESFLDFEGLDPATIAEVNRAAERVSPD